MSDIDKTFGTIGAGLKLADSAAGLIDGFFGISAKRQENAQKRLMDKQQDQWKEQQGILNDYMLEQWNRENEYNDPTNYYKRLLQGADANGISKAGALGDMPGGMVGQAASKNSPGGNTGTGVGSPSALGFGSTSSLAGLRQRAEIDLLESQAEKNRADAGLSDAKTTTELLERKVKQADFDLKTALAGQAKESIAVLKQEKIYKQNQNRVFDAVTQAELDKAKGAFLASLGSFLKNLGDFSLTEDKRRQIAQQVAESVANTAVAYAYRDKIVLDSYMPEQMKQYFEDNPELLDQYLKTNVDMLAEQLTGISNQNDAFWWNTVLGHLWQGFDSISGGLGSLLRGFTSYKGLATQKGPKTTSTIENWTDKNGEFIGGKSTTRTESR